MSVRNCSLLWTTCSVTIVQANGYVTNSKDAATQVEAETRPASSAYARRALLENARGVSFVR